MRGEPLFACGPYDPTRAFSLASLATFLYTTSLSRQRCNTVLGLLAENGTTWSTAEGTITTQIDTPKSWMRPFGDAIDFNAHYHHSAEASVWIHKCADVLMRSDAELSAEDVMAALPSAKDAIEFAMCRHTLSIENCILPFCNVLMSCACVSDKLGRHKEALMYTLHSLPYLIIATVFLRICTKTAIYHSATFLMFWSPYRYNSAMTDLGTPRRGSNLTSVKVARHNHARASS